MTKAITFDELHQLVSNIDFIYGSSYPVAFTVDGVKYRAGIGVFNTDGSDEKEDFSYFFYEYDDIIQYLSRIENSDVGASFNCENTCGHNLILDAQDPDDMIFDEIGDMLKKCCNITESSDIKLYTDFSFSGERYDIFWMDLDQDVIEKERRNAEALKTEMATNDVD